MRIPKDRFLADVDPELTCKFCQYSSDESVVFTTCKHAFCRICLPQDIAPSRHLCRICRSFNGGFRKPKKDTQKSWKKLLVKCEWYKNGCPEMYPLEFEELHVTRCLFNPNQGSYCPECGYFGILNDPNGVHPCLHSFKQKRIEEIKGQQIPSHLEVVTSGSEGGDCSQQTSSSSSLDTSSNNNNQEKDSQIRDLKEKLAVEINRNKQKQETIDKLRSELSQSIIQNEELKRELQKLNPLKVISISNKFNKDDVMFHTQLRQVLSSCHLLQHHRQMRSRVKRQLEGAGDTHLSHFKSMGRRMVIVGDEGNAFIQQNKRLKVQVEEDTHPDTDDDGWNCGIKLSSKTECNSRKFIPSLIPDEVRIQTQS